MADQKKASYEKVVLKDSHLVNGKIIPKGYILLIKKDK